MSEAVEAAKSLLRPIEDILPFHVNEMTLPEDDPVIATIRNQAGYPVLAPHPEAMSMLTGKRDVFKFFVIGPKVIRDLIAEIEDLQQASGEKKVPDSK